MADASPSIPADLALNKTLKFVPSAFFGALTFVVPVFGVLATALSLSENAVLSDRIQKAQKYTFSERGHMIRKRSRARRGNRLKIAGTVVALAFSLGMNGLKGSSFVKNEAVCQGIAHAVEALGF